MNVKKTKRTLSHQKHRAGELINFHKSTCSNTLGGCSNSPWLSVLIPLVIVLIPLHWKGVTRPGVTGWLS